jgi:hypothetical protein
LFGSKGYLGYLTFNSKIHPTSRFQTLRFRHSALVDFRHSALANFLVHSALPDDEPYIQATLLDQNILTIRRAKITKLKGMLITVTRLHTNILDYIVQMESILRACLGGLRLRLHERLRPEPCQTVETAPALGVEPELEPLAAFKGEVEPRFGGFTRLQLEIHQRSYFAKRFFKTT